MPIYTRTGDRGTTGTASGRRVSKASLEIEAGGCVDELSAFLGLARTEQTDDAIKSLLLDVQQSLLTLGGDVAMDDSRLSETEVVRLEQAIDLYSKSLPPFHEFVLPGDNRASATLHVARTVCRRVERVLVQYDETRTTESQKPISPCVLRYLNRLSDLLFVLARAAGKGNSAF